jgi:hypothetical protein
MYKVFKSKLTNNVYCISGNNGSVLDFEANDEYILLKSGTKKICEEYCKEHYSDYTFI